MGIGQPLTTGLPRHLSAEDCLGGSITYGLGGLQIAMPRPQGYAEGAYKHHERHHASSSLLDGADFVP